MKLACLFSNKFWSIALEEHGLLTTNTAFHSASTETNELGTVFLFRSGQDTELIHVVIRVLCPTSLRGHLLSLCRSTERNLAVIEADPHADKGAHD